MWHEHRVGFSQQERRRWHRIKLAIPVHVSTGTGTSGPVNEPFAAQSVDVCPGGCYVTTRHEALFAPGEILAVWMVIPRDARRAFPFSRVAGLCRVLRTDAMWTPEGKAQGLALAFCEPHTVMLGSPEATPPQEMVTIA